MGKRRRPSDLSHSTQITTDDSAGKLSNQHCTDEQDPVVASATTATESHTGRPKKATFREPAKLAKSLPTSRDPSLTDLALISKWERAQEWRCDPDPAYARGIKDYSVEANMRNPVVLLHQHDCFANRSKRRDSWVNKRWHAPF